MPAALLQSLQDHLALHEANGFGEGGNALQGREDAFLVLEKVCGRLAEGGVAVKKVVELADVARPVVVHHGEPHVVGELDVDGGVLLPGADEQGNVLLAVAQGRQGDGKDVDAVVEVGAHGLVLDLGVEIAVGGRNEAEGGLLGGVRAEGRVALGLEHAQELDLQVEGEFPYFVEEEGAVVGRADEARFVARGAREGTLGVAEEFAFQQVFGDGAAVDRYEGALAAAVVVDGARDQILAAARLAVDDDVCIGFGCPEDEAVDLVHGLAFADEGAEAVDVLHAHLELPVFVLQGQLEELLAADVRQHALEVEDGAVGAVDGLALVPDPLEGAVGQLDAVDHLVGPALLDGFLAQGPHLLDVGRQRHPLDGVPLLLHHEGRRDAEQRLASRADVLQRHAVVFADPAAVDHARKPVDELLDSCLDAFVVSFVVHGHLLLEAVWKQRLAGAALQARLSGRQGVSAQPLYPHGRSEKRGKALAQNAFPREAPKQCTVQRQGCPPPLKH